MKRRLLWVLMFLLCFNSACSGTLSLPAAAYVDLEQRVPLPTPLNSAVAPLRVAVAAVISPQGTVESYNLLLESLQSHLNRPIELVQRRTYLEINDLLEQGQVDVAFVCTSAYIAGSEKFGMELLVAPQVKGETVYYSLLLVPSDSSATSIADLRGKVFAFTDPISLSGRMYPTYLVMQQGSTPDEFFGRVFFTYSHDQAILAVANKVADGAAVDSLVYEFFLARDATIGEKTRVIHRSPPFGIPPVVVNPALRPQLKLDLQNFFLSLHEDAQGQAALKAIGVDRFVPIEDSAYQSVRDLLSNLNATR
ncbi:MAG: phosphate/phosphite/phosphonate ABC transporter substrate-binding protein [Anaerolineae bacterium]|jgi:phosphonate transport system substrate-binding protein|nr:MAG: phosphate/phosphite/phosphonate ABC transporter substrate-binding protein [Anaerolineae bacterium]